MIGGKLPVSIATLAMLNLSMPAFAAAGSASGIASNRMALAMPLAPEGGTPPCPPNADGSVAHCAAADGSGGTGPHPMHFLLAGVAAAGAIAAVAVGASGGHDHGGGTSPVSP